MIKIGVLQFAAGYHLLHIINWTDATVIVIDFITGQCDKVGISRQTQVKIFSSVLVRIQMPSAGYRQTNSSHDASCIVPYRMTKVQFLCCS
jgi:hypothetical protein